MLQRFARSFIRRLSNGEILNTCYLTWFYIYLYVFDLKHGTQFAVSHPPLDSHQKIGGTGNFPAHPQIVRRLLRASKLDHDAPIIDIGHGSGIALFTAAQMGFTNITGIEHGPVPYELSVRNLRGRAQLIHGDAFSVDLARFKAILFFNPFSGERAKQFFSNLPNSVTHVITVNQDPIVEPVLQSQGFFASIRYRHPIYINFGGVLWRR